MESATGRKSPMSEMEGLRSLDIVGYSTTHGLMDKSQANSTRPPSTAAQRVVKIGLTLNNSNNTNNGVVVGKPPRHHHHHNLHQHQRLLTRRLPDKEDTQLKLGLSGSTAFASGGSSSPNTTPRRSKSSLVRKNSVVSSLPSIPSSKAGSEQMNVTPYYDSDFGFHFDRLGPSVGMSAHKPPPVDHEDLEQELALAAEKHIYSLQIVSMANRGSRRTECVHSLLNTIWPPPTRARPLVRDSSSIKWPPSGSRSKPLTRANTHVWGASPSPSPGRNFGKLHRFNPHEIGGLGPVKPPGTPNTAISMRAVTPGPRN